MRALFVIILLAALFLPSGRAPASPPNDFSTGDLQTLQAEAAQGHAEAQVELGYRYYDGKGVLKDYVMAREWYEKAAAQGNARAQRNLGMLYDFGHGVPQDYTKARGWYEKVAAQGDSGAQFTIGLMYNYGRGVPQNNVKAYMWWSLATAHGNKLATQERDKVVMKMTPAQISEGQRLAQQCQAQHFKDC